jgi:hypothetical protein
MASTPSRPAGTMPRARWSASRQPSPGTEELLIIGANLDAANELARAVVKLNTRCFEKQSKKQSK